MFTIYADGESIYQPLDEELQITSAKLTLEMGKAGSLQFVMPPNHRYYSRLEQLRTVITVELDGEEIFRGRILSNSRNFTNMRTVYCEGNLAYLVDSVQVGERYTGTVHGLFRQIIETHNAEVEDAKQFAIGTVNVEDREVLIRGTTSEDSDPYDTDEFDYEQVVINATTKEWKTSYDAIESWLIDNNGGYLRTRMVDGVQTIDFLQDYESTATQEIEFGVNLLDMNEEISAEDLFTVLIPLGDDNLTIADVNNGSIFLVDEDAAAVYGSILKTKVFDSVTNPETLLENGQRYLESNVNIPTTITVKAVDMHLVDGTVRAIQLGDRVHLNSLPHNLVDYLTCTKIEYDLENPANNTYTFGTPKQSLTERYRKDKRVSEATRKSGGGAAAEEAEEEALKTLDRFYNAYINVDASAGNISLYSVYQELQNNKRTLEQSCGISLDAPTGNINIKNLRTEFNEFERDIKNQTTQIDLKNEELESRIEATAAYSERIGSLENAHYASLILTAGQLESSIALKADRVTVDAMQISLNAEISKMEMENDKLYTVLRKCGIDVNATSGFVNITALERKLDEEGKEVSNLQATVKTLAADSKSQVSLLAEAGTKIAALEVTATKLQSAIDLKADTVTLEADTATIKANMITLNGKISNLSAELAKVDELIATRIRSIWTSSLEILCKKITIGGRTVEWNANNGTLKMGGDFLATQAWVKSYVAGLLATYSAKTHTHSWSEITDKPATFAPASHTHAFSGSTTLYWNHKHGDNGYVNSYGSKTIAISGTTGKN